MHGSAKKLGKSVARGSALKWITHGKKNAAVLLRKYISEEPKYICSDNFYSILRENSRLAWNILAGVGARKACCTTHYPAQHALKLLSTDK